MIALLKLERFPAPSMGRPGPAITQACPCAQLTSLVGFACQVPAGVPLWKLLGGQPLKNH